MSPELADVLSAIIQRAAALTARSRSSPLLRPSGTPPLAALLKGDTALVNLLRNAIEAASDDDGWALLGTVGHIIVKQRPDFDSRTYGYAKLTDLITATTLFDIDRRSPGDDKPGVLYVRDKRRLPDKRL